MSQLGTTPYEWTAEKDTASWIGILNWAPQVKKNDRIIWDGAGVFGTGPRLWALWMAFRKARHFIKRIGA